MMTLSILLSPEAEAALRQRAVAAGKEPIILATEMLSRMLTGGGLSPKRLEEISGDSQRAFAASGMTDLQLGEELEAIKHADRSKKRGITFHE
jgi:hypothetical protein